MKVSSIYLRNFKRFYNLRIEDIPRSTKLVIVVGPNGSGKSSLFDAFNHYYRNRSGFAINTDEKYFRKLSSEQFDWDQSVVVRFHDHPDNQRLPKNSMYFRTAYRNDPDFNISSFTRVGVPHEQLRINRFIDNDQTVSLNYQRLVHTTMAGIFSEKNDNKSVKELRDELIGKIRNSMLRVFDDLVLNNIGDPLGDGSFYFKKGNVDSYHYKNLSGGEKAVFDLLLDLIIKLEHYDNTVFFIDEAETHMHTSLQGRLLEEMYRLIPENSQMWVSTHSLGVMRKAKTLSVSNPGSVVFIDFGEADFDHETTITPASIDGLMWEKFLSIALDDYASLIAPEIIVMCEGDINGNKRKNFDSYLYGKIFGKKYPQIAFVSGGSCSEIEKSDHIGFKLLSEVLSNTRHFRLIDRDDKSNEEVEELEKQKIFTTNRRNIESYLLDDELIVKLVHKYFTPSLVNDDPANPMTGEEKRNKLAKEALEIKARAVENSITRGNPPDDIKSARGEIYNGLKKLLKLTRCGNNADMFIRDTMSDLLTEETEVFKEMEREIIEKILSA